MKKTLYKSTLIFSCVFSLFFVALLGSFSHNAAHAFFGKQKVETYAALSGFEPNAIVEYKVFSNKSDFIHANARTDKNGFLNISLPENLGTQSDRLIYDFKINEAERNLSLVLRLNPKTGGASIKGEGADAFTDIRITASGQNIDTRSDWAGLFEETGIKIKADKNEPLPVQVAFYSRNVASDAQHHQSPAMIKVQSVSGGSQASITSNYIHPLQLMAEQISVVAMQQVMAIGTFFDAKLQLETQRTHQRLKAEAIKDYHPSEQMCRIGSYVRSLASTEAKIKHDQLAINSIMMKTYTNQQNMVSDSGDEGHYEDRLEQYKRIYCDISDNNKGLDILCLHDGGIGGQNADRVNKDVDFTRTVEYLNTLDVDYTDTITSNDETDIIALARNLYWPNAFSRINEDLVTERSQPYAHARQLIALSSLAHSSFAHYVASKSKAPEPAAIDQPGWMYMKTMMREFGMEDPDIEALVGDRPSYYAQMDILTKKIYQNPDFYTNLYNKPVNVNRVNASLEAIRLMQMRDHYNASLRREMLLSGIIQHEASIHAEKIQGKLVN